MANTDLFLVDVKVTPANDITIVVDSPTGVDIDTCADITRAVEAAFDRDADDYSLEVGSAGLTAPFTVRGQYEKNLGNDVELVNAEGRKLRGVLAEVAPGDPTDTDVDFTLETAVKEIEPGAKRPVQKLVQLKLNSKDCKYVKYDLKF